MFQDFTTIRIAGNTVELCPRCRSQLVHRSEFCDSRHLQRNKDHVFVFGDNLDRFGFGGAAILRYEPNTYGFITKKHPDNEDGSFYTVEEYKDVFEEELELLKKEITEHPEKLYLITKLGAGLANKYKIWENVIQERLTELPDEFENVRLLFDPND